jgi:4-amino-4-deoxy-L-arabinose transferase-like glycosyltransferase
MINTFKKNFFYIALIVVSFFYIYDLSNLDGIRQGTEGFYLQISKEMFQQNSFLTPYYHDIRHWSKPPLHFVFPFPFYYTDLFTNIFSARVSIAILTIVLLYMASVWTERHFKIARYTTFLYFACTIGMIKYARIFMMEIPLSLLTFVGTLYFYDYLTTKTKKSFFISSGLIAASVLIKGPVSFVLFGGAVFMWGAHMYYHHKKNDLVPFIKFCVVTGLLASIWFVISYIRYGDEFFNYFFLRENMGKFNTKSYPIRHVIQGLFIFALPWSFYLPSAVKSYIQEYKDNNRIAPLKMYLLICTFVFLVIWLIPTQRSHHYAMPSVPFFLLSILIPLFEMKDKIISDKYFKYSSVSAAVFFGVLAIILTIATFYINTILPGQGLMMFMIFSLIILYGSIYIFSRKTSLTLKSISSLFFVGWIWVMIAPKFIPPFVPSKVIEQVGTKPLTTYIKKPYFLEEALNREVNKVSKAHFATLTPECGTLYILNYDDYVNYNLPNKTKILHKWEIWRRRTRFKQVVQALRNDDITSIKQSYVLFTGI